MSNTIFPKVASDMPVPVEFSPKEFMELVQEAVEDGHENVHDFILEATTHKESSESPANVVPFPEQ